MKKQFVEAKNGQFFVDNIPLRLRGFGIGSWMNLEHFMLRIPGSDKQIRQVFTDVYGLDKANRFFDDLLTFFIDNEDFQFLSSLGVNSIRIAINYRHFETDQAPGQYMEEGFKHIDRLLKLCRYHNIYAILDMHAVPGGQNPDLHSGSTTGSAQFWNDACFRERTITLWQYIATRYANDTIIAGYDILNEPAFVSDKKAFNDFYQNVTQSIRSVDNNHIIFIEGDYWARDFSLFEKLGGYQQALSFHFYPGQHVSIYDADDIRQKQIFEKLEYYTKLREETGMPLWVGETGGLFPANKRSQGTDLIRQCLEAFEKLGISWSFWSYKDAQSMSLVYPKSDSPWMKFVNSLRANWQSKKTRTENVTWEIFDLIYDKLGYDIDSRTREEWSFRLSSLLYDHHAQFLLKPKLQSTPWKETKELPKSFLWSSCDYRQELAMLIKNLSSRQR